MSTTGTQRRLDAAELAAYRDDGVALLPGAVDEYWVEALLALVDGQMRTLQAAIFKVSAGDTTLPMLISADAQASHQSVVRAMDAAGKVGLTRISITTRQPDDED